MSEYKDRTELLVKAAKLYYENNYSQDMVAKKLKLSRPYISKLLNEAKEVGIVRVEILDPTKIESKLEKEIREKFNLKKAIVVLNETKEPPLSKVGKAAAKYLESILKNGDVIGLSWGETLYYCSQELSSNYDLENVIAVQLCGGISNLQNKNIYASEISQNFASALSGISYILPLPAVVDDRTLKNLMLQDNNIHKIIEFGEKANIALFTMGAFGVNSALVRAGYLSEKQMLNLSENGAVGDICSHFIDINGNICSKELDERTIAVPLEVIKQKEYRIGVAIGQSKVDSICGALRGGLVNVLITNEFTAKLVLNRLETLD